MQNYLCQIREGEQAAPNPYRPKGQLKWSGWRTVKSYSEEDANLAERWLGKPVRGLTQKRIKRGKDFTVECGGGIHFFITRIEAENYNL